jgi:hypothetical protein
MSRTKRLSWAVTAALCLALFPIIQHASPDPLASPQSEEPALRAEVARYVEALTKEELAAFKALWSRSADPAARAVELEQLFALDDYSYANVEISGITVSTGRASLRVAFDRISKRTMILERSSPTPKPVTERVTRNLSFVLESGEWKLARDVSAVEDIANALIQAKTDAERSAILEKESNLLMIELRQELLQKATGFFVGQQLAEALNVYSIAKAVSERAGDQEGAAISLSGMGNIHRARREYVMAEARYREALARFEAIKEDEQAAGLLEYIGFVQQPGLNPI